MSRSLTPITQDENRLRTVEIPNSIKFFMTHNQQTQPIQCHYAVSKEYINTITSDTTVESPHFPITTLENYLYLPVSYHEFKTKHNLWNICNKTKSTI